jgi:hypothetical protein
MLDVMVYLPRNAWGWVLLDVEKKIETAALERIISVAYGIEEASAHSEGASKRKRKRQNAINAPKIVASIPPTAGSSGDQLQMQCDPVRRDKVCCHWQPNGNGGRLI